MRLRSSPSAAAASSGASVVQVRPVLPLSNRRRRKRGAGLVEAAEDLLERLSGRPQPVARVERRPLPEHAVELEVGERGLEHERAEVVADGELVLGDGELGADGMLEHVREQAGERLARRRVAVGEVLERRHVVGAGEQLADALLAVASGAADLLRVRLEALRQVVVVDVADVGLVDPHPERDRRDHDPLRRARPPLLHRDALLACSCRRGRGAPAGRPRRAARRSAAAVRCSVTYTIVGPGGRSRSRSTSSASRSPAATGVVSSVRFGR